MANEQRKPWDIRERIPIGRVPKVKRMSEGGVAPVQVSASVGVGGKPKVETPSEGYRDKRMKVRLKTNIRRPCPSRLQVADGVLRLTFPPSGLTARMVSGKLGCTRSVAWEALKYLEESGLLKSVMFRKALHFTKSGVKFTGVS